MIMKKRKWFRGDKLELNPKGETIKFACCDCGLTHNIAFALEDNGKIGMAWERNEKQTKQNRNSWKK